MILISDPLGNEPGYEDFAKTEAGRSKSREYNHVIRLENLRHAVLGNLRNPPAGKLGEIIKSPFKLSLSTNIMYF